MPTPADIITVASGAVPIYGGRAAPLAGRTGDVVLAGDSLTGLAYASGGYRLGLPLTLYPPRVIYNAGIPNDTIKNLVDRFDADVIAKGAPTAIVRIGTNGAGAGTYQDQFNALFAKLQAANMFGIFMAIPPKNVGTPGVPSGFVAQNAWIKAACEAAPTRLAFIQDSLALGDADYNVISSYYIDNIHMNGKGVVAQGDAMAPFMSAIFAPVETRNLSATDSYAQNAASNQYVNNGQMSGGTTLATGWTLSPYGTAPGTASKVAADAGDPVQTPWQRIEYTGSGGNTHALSLRSTMTHPAIDASVKRFDIVAEVRFNSLDTTLVNNFALSIDAGSNAIAGCNIPIQGNGLFTRRVVMRDALSRNTGNAYAANTLRVNLALSFTNTFSGSIGSIDIRCVSVRGSTT